MPGLVANEEKCNKISRTVSNAEGIVFGAPGFRVAGAGNDHKIAATGTLFPAGRAERCGSTGCYRLHAD